jgi:ubiquinone/menaquinone biosynthesis C-methylase UbiE
MHDHSGADFDWNAMYAEDDYCHAAPDPLVLACIADLEPGRALDIGCGVGTLVEELAQRGWQVTGVDIASNAIAIGQKRLETRQLEAELHVADASKWSPSGSFDLVTNCFALPMTKDDQEKVFRMARSALAPGGTLIIKDFDPSMKEEEGPFASFHYPTVEEMLAVFEGLEIVRAEVVSTPPHHDDGEQGSKEWTATFVHARKVG